MGYIILNCQHGQNEQTSHEGTQGKRDGRSVKRYAFVLIVCTPLKKRVGLFHAQQHSELKSHSLRPLNSTPPFPHPSLTSPQSLHLSTHSLPSSLSLDLQLPFLRCPDINQETRSTPPRRTAGTIWNPWPRRTLAGPILLLQKVSGILFAFLVFVGHSFRREIIRESRMFFGEQRREFF